MRYQQNHTNKLKLEKLRRLISEEARRILVEAEEEKKESEDSLDSQVDSFFSSYENEAKNVKKEGRDFRSFVRRFLMEAGEDEEGGDEGDEDKEEEKEPEKMSADDINIESFSDNVVRLIDNYDSLMEVRNTILRRAANFLAKSYEKDVVDAFKDDVMERHGLEIGKSKAEMEDEDFSPPPAVGAGTSPGA